MDMKQQNVNLQYDVCIAGAGPCGLMTAKKLAEQGIKVAVFDRKPEAKFFNPGIMEMLSLQPNKIKVDEKEIYFTESGFSLDKHSVKNEIYGFATYSPGKYALTLRSIFPTNYRIDYTYWIEKLEKETKDSGAKIFYGQEIVEIIKNKDRAEAIVVEDCNSNRKTVKFNHLVAADGIRSKISRLAGVRKEHWGVHRIVGARVKEFDISKTSKGELFDPVFHNMYLNKKFSGPNTLAITAYLGNGEMYVIAVIQDTRLNDHASGSPQDIFDNFLNFLKSYDACAKPFNEAKSSTKFAYFLPVDSPIANPFDEVKGMSFLGDTAFTIETQWTGAMAVAAKAAEAIAAVLNSNGSAEAINAYHTWWGKFVKNAKRQYDFSTFMHALEEEELNELFSIFNEEMVIPHLEGCDDEFGTPNEFIKNMDKKLIEVNPSELKSPKVRMLVEMLKKRSGEMNKK